MNLYTFLSLGYDLLDVVWFGERGTNPRDIIRDMIPNRNYNVLDMCCGTMSNGLSIARDKPNCKIYGIDRSKEMLRGAKRKIRKSMLSNIKVKTADATAVDLKEKSFDYIVIGLVLHECSPELRAGILREAHRLLKEDGNLIILEWEKEDGILRKIKFAPLYCLELLTCKSFKEFFNCDKADYFMNNGFEMRKKIHCNYSSVMVLTKKISL